MIALTSIPVAFALFFAGVVCALPLALICYGLWVFGGWCADKIDQRRWPRN